MAATPALQVVEREGIRHALHEYEHDSTARSFGDEAVEKLGWPAERAFKPLYCRLPRFASLRFPARGCTLAGQRAHALPPRPGRDARATALEHETILVNGGRRGLQLELAPDDLVRLTAARVHPIASVR